MGREEKAGKLQKSRDKGMAKAKAKAKGRKVKGMRISAGIRRSAL